MSGLPGVQIDETMSAYATDSRLRQQIDTTAVITTLADRLSTAGTVADLGCGVGDLLARLGDLAPTTATLVGIDASVRRIEGCRSRFAADPRAHFIATDLLGDLPISDVDVTTMTAVLHWLHPHEESVLLAVAQRLSPTGVFALTTYHPEPEIDGLGGTDSVVAAALGADPDTTVRGVAGRFIDAGVLPVSRRTRPREEIAKLLRSMFASIGTHDNLARTAPASGTEFASYFVSTFGDYYRPLFPSGEAMRSAVATAADRRLAELGHVTSMNVTTWTCRVPRSTEESAR